MRLIAILVALSCALCLAPPAIAGGLYAQTIVTFPNERPVTYEYVQADNALVIAFQKTASHELDAFDHYDERLVRRVLMKDLGPAGVEVRLVLRDRNVRALVTKFNEPFRVAIDIFDASYQEERDPITGLPVSDRNSISGDARDSSEGFSLMNPEGSAGGEDAQAFNSAPSTEAGDSQTKPLTEGKRRLLQAMPPAFDAEGDLAAALRNTGEGLGKAWLTYPAYIYRLQTAAYEEGLNNRRGSDEPNLTQAMSSTEAMADYAGSLFNFGHETRALLIYQQVLHKDPRLFDKDALHLWKLSEIQFGQGNLTLARGYYQAIIEKHPESPLALFARLRVLDIGAVRLLNQGRAKDLANLLTELANIKPRHVGELQALLALRRAWWNKDAEPQQSFAELPTIDPTVRADLAAAYPGVENSRTAFLAASLLLADMAQASTPWQRSTGPFADSYFKRFSGATTDIYQSKLRDRLYEKLNKSIQSKVAEGKLLEAIDDYEALPTSMRGIIKTPATAWALAEAYRKLSQGEKAVDLYATAAKASGEGPERFKAQFWLSVTAGELAHQIKNSNQARSQRLERLSRDADRSAEASWDKLKKEEQGNIIVAYKNDIERAITGHAKLKTPARITLASWTQALATFAPAQSGELPDANQGGAVDWQRQFSPSGSAVILLTDLAKRFSELGMTSERRQTLNLLKDLKPSQFEDDKAAKEIWTAELVKLAEDYRNANQYLEAGRLYNLVGSESENWSGRAEALYKGGLLLFRAGRRQEAMDSFKKASEDGDNLFYANLAKERLAQLE